MFALSGVLISGTCSPGTILALYPGTLYTPDHLSNPQVLEAVIKGNEYLISRFDTIVVDGRDWPLQAVHSRKTRELSKFAGIGVPEIRNPSDASVADEREEPEDAPQDRLRFCNPFGIGNYVNHPPPGVFASCSLVALS